MANENLKITLNPPLVVGMGKDKKEYKELEFDFQGLTGQNAVDVDQEMMMSNQIADVNVFSVAYLGKLAAKAAGVSSKVVESLPIKDFNKVARRTQLFLLGEDSTETNSENGREDSASTSPDTPTLP